LIRGFLNISRKRKANELKLEGPDSGCKASFEQSSFGGCRFLIWCATSVVFYSPLRFLASVEAGMPVRVLRELIEDALIVMLGCIRQEIFPACACTINF